MKYSIVIPVYNAEKVLSNCVYSIFETGLSDFEVILINDGSTDNSAAICEKLCVDYPQVVYIYQENSGVSAARNNGLKHTRGEYILFCDADDYFTPDCFRNIDSILADNIDVIIYGISFDYYHKGFCYRKDNLLYPQSGIQEITSWSQNFEVMYEYNVLLPVWNKIYKRDIIVRNHLNFDTKMILLEDLVFSVGYLAHCNEIYFLNQVAYHYRQSENERNAHNRLERIPSINAMVQDIRYNFDSANFIIIEKYGCELCGIDKICYQIYYMLVSQKIYYAPIGQIRKCSLDVLESKYYDEAILTQVGVKTFQLYKNLSQQKFWKIRLYNLYCQIRHSLAVQYKYYRCKIRGN